MRWKQWKIAYLAAGALAATALFAAARGGDADKGGSALR